VRGGILRSTQEKRKGEGLYSLGERGKKKALEETEGKKNERNAAFLKTKKEGADIATGRQGISFLLKNTSGEYQRKVP